METPMRRAKGVLLNVTGGLDLGIHEVYEAAELLREHLDDDANFVWGYVPDPSMEGTVQMVVIGTVSSFGYRSRRMQSCIFGSKVIQEAEAVVDVRLVDVDSGRIIASESGRGVVAVAAGQVLGFGASAGYDETMAANALRAAISKFVDKLIDQGLDQR